MVLTRPQPTKALFRTITNVDEGVLIGWVKWGPRYMGRKQKPQVTTLPKLKQWADIAFLTWAEQARIRQKDVTKLEHIISADIHNKNTEQILQHILQVDDVRAHCHEYEWNEDGQNESWSIDTDEGKALLSSEYVRLGVQIQCLATRLPIYP
jgi:hypothetical protein